MLKKRILSIVLALTMLMVPGAYAAQPAKDDMRGVWVASVHNIDFPSEQGMTADQLKAEADTELDNIAAMGLNTVFLQVRPSADALYPSELFPWSRYVSGTAGQAPDGSFDVLGYWVTAAHERGLQLHAWINPYRITIDGEDEWNAIPDSSPAKQHPEWVVKYNDNYYFDPGIPAVQQLVVDGAAEIVKNYDVDGIHFDDYFYPTTDPAFDAADYAASGTALTRDDWRRENVNALVELCHATARRYGVRFGVAPVGDPEQNYALQYSDAARWLRQGTVDYLMPQLYWGQEYVKDGDTSHSLARLAGAWAALPRAAGVRLYAGLGAYRIGAGDGSDAGSEWVSGRALADQLNLLDRLGVQGAGLYRYASLFDASDYAGLAAAEVDAVRQVWQIDQRSKD